MKKILLGTVLAALLSLSLSGCGLTTAHLNQGEDLGAEYAYVTGRYIGPTDILNLGWEEASLFEFSAADYSTVVLKNEAAYEVQKVHPGKYSIYYIKLPNDRVLTGDGQPMASVHLEAGKITYLGDIHIFFAGGQPGLMDTRATPIIRTSDNSEAAKQAILKAHPELSGRLDSLFVFKMVQ